MKCRVRSWNMQQSRVSGVISMFDGRQVRGIGHSACQSWCQNDLSWHCERGAHHVLYAALECNHHLWGPVLNGMEQPWMASQQPDGYDPVVNWLECLSDVANSHRLGVISSLGDLSLTASHETVITACVRVLTLRSLQSGLNLFLYSSCEHF